MSANKIVNPLTHNIPIVDENRFPTQEFMRKWAQQNSVNGTIPSLDTQAKVSAVLDAISSTQGAILYRGASLWSVLTPGTVGNKLTTQGASADPSWTADPTVQDLLDGISNTRGTVLYRGASGWAALPPGVAAQVLATGGVGADPAWVDQSGGVTAFTGLSDVPSSYSGAAGKLVAVNTAANALEFILASSPDVVTGSRASGSSVSIPTATVVGITSITLPAGTWVIGGNVSYDFHSAPTPTRFIIGLATSPTGLPANGDTTRCDYFYPPGVAFNATMSLPTAPHVVPLTAAATFYMNTYVDGFSSGTITAYGTLRAVKVG